MYCDETNLEHRKGDFFVYGGVAVSGEAIQSLSKAVDDIRKYYGVEPFYKLKFNPGPQGLSHEQFIKFKQDIVCAAVEHGAALFTSLILHDIATSPDLARRNGINTVCYHFDCFLHPRDSHGLVLIDRFSDSQIDAHLIEKFSVGIVGLPYTPEMKLKRIMGFHYSAVGQSHMPSIVDVVLGGLRHSINGFTRGNDTALKAASRILPAISPLFHRHTGVETISDLGFFLSPKEVKSDSYKKKYTELIKFLSDNGVIIS